MNHFFIEINLDKSLGMDLNYILVALFGLFFFFFGNLYVHGNSDPHNFVPFPCYN